MISAGDWVHGTIYGMRMRGYVVEVVNSKAFVNITYPMTGGSCFMPLHELTKYSGDSVHADDLKLLIDMALEQGDREWFISLTNEQKMLQESQKLISKKR